MPSITHIKINDTIYDIKDQNALRVTSDAYVNSFTVSTNNPQITMKATGINLTTTPTNTANYSNGILFTDTNNTAFGRIRGAHYKEGSAAGIDLYACRTVGSATYYNDFALSIDSTGKRSASFTEPKVIRDALGLTETSWTALTNSSVFDGTIRYRRFYNFVELRGYGLKLKTALSSASVTLGTLSNSAFQPAHTVVCYAGTPSTPNAVGCVLVSTNGGIAFHKPSGTNWSTSMNIHFQVLYMTAS